MVDPIELVGQVLLWIRLTGDGTREIVYEYSTTGANGQGVFGMSVLHPGMDPEIEHQLDRIIQGVAFDGITPVTGPWRLGFQPLPLPPV